eukprot:6462665-Amphidinium_carterae.1
MTKVRKIEHGEAFGVAVMLMSPGFILAKQNEHRARMGFFLGQCIESLPSLVKAKRARDFGATGDIFGIGRFTSCPSHATSPLSHRSYASGKTLPANSSLADPRTGLRRFSSASRVWHRHDRYAAL